MVGICLAAVSITLLHRVEPGAGPIDQPLSWYVHGPYGWLWVAAMCVAGGGVLQISNESAAIFPRTRFRQIATGVALGLFGVGAFPTDAWFPWERRPTIVGGLHVLAALAVAGGITILTTSTAHAALRREPRRTGTLLRALSIAYLSCLVATATMVIWTVNTSRPVRYVGLAERALLVIASLWFITLGLGAPAGSDDASR